MPNLAVADAHKVGGAAGDGLVGVANGGQDVEGCLCSGLHELRAIGDAVVASIHLQHVDVRRGEIDRPPGVETVRRVSGLRGNGLPMQYLSTAFCWRTCLASTSPPGCRDPSIGICARVRHSGMYCNEYSVSNWFYIAAMQAGHAWRGRLFMLCCWQFLFHSLHCIDINHNVLQHVLQQRKVSGKAHHARLLTTGIGMTSTLLEQTRGTLDHDVHLVKVSTHVYPPTHSTARGDGAPRARHCCRLQNRCQGPQGQDAAKPPCAPHGRHDAAQRQQAGMHVPATWHPHLVIVPDAHLRGQGRGTQGGHCSTAR